MNSGRLLIIEDDARVSRFMRNVAARLGLKCVTVGVNGDIEAACQKAHPDVVYLDPNTREEQSKNALESLAEQHTEAAIVLGNVDSSLILELIKTGDSLGLKMAGVLPDVLDADILKQEFISIFSNHDEQATDKPDLGKELKLTEANKRSISTDLHH
jgi:DNA-binding NarL/FixJ family response regulator